MTRHTRIGGRTAAGLALGAALGWPAAAQEVELTFSHFLGEPSTEAPNVEAAIERFREAHPEVELDAQVSGTDEYLTQFNVGAAAGALSDVFMIVGADIDAISRAGLIADISEEFEADAEWSGSIQPDMMAEFTRGDAVYSVPYGQIITHVIFWNEDIFAEAGIDGFPETWDGFLEAIDKLEAHGVTPISLGNKARWVVADPVIGTMIFRMTGREWFDRLRAREAEFTDPEFVAAIEKFQELVERDAFNADANSLDNQQQRRPYVRGEAAMFIEGSWAIPTIIEEATPEVRAATRMAAWPEMEGGRTPATAVTGGAGWSFGINSELEGEERAAAIDLLKELSSVEYGESRLAIGLLPAQVIDTSGMEIDPLLAELASRPAEGEMEILPIFTNWLPRSILDVLGQELQDLMVGNATPMEVAEALQQDYERSR